ncbi:TSUP family transporter [Streptomyces sp. NPDC001840]
MLTVAQLASNGSRVWFNRHEIDRRLVGVFAYGAVPAAAAGAWLFATAPLPALTRLIGVFLLAMVAWRLDGGHGRRASRRPRSPRSERPAASARHWSAPSAPWSPRSSSPAASSAAPTSVPKPPPRS